MFKEVVVVGEKGKMEEMGIGMTLEVEIVTIGLRGMKKMNIIIGEIIGRKTIFQNG